MTTYTESDIRVGTMMSFVKSLGCDMEAVESFYLVRQTLDKIETLANSDFLTVDIFVAAYTQNLFYSLRPAIWNAVMGSRSWNDKKAYAEATEVENKFVKQFGKRWNGM